MQRPARQSRSTKSNTVSLAEGQAHDVPLIGATTKVLVRSDLHPEIVQLLLQTMTEVHSGPNIFQRIGEFPNSTDVEFPVAPAAIDFYKNGPSFMQRHLPLWLSVHAGRYRRFYGGVLEQSRYRPREDRWQTPISNDFCRACVKAASVHNPGRRL